MTRTTDRFINLTPERCPDADMSISIHVNSGGGTGLETWVSLFHHTEESHKLGQSIQSGILERVDFADRGLKSKANKYGTDDYLYMLRKPPGISVLVECGFIDSEHDIELLRQPEQLERIADGIAVGVLRYLGMEKGIDSTMQAKVSFPDVNVLLDGKSQDKCILLNVDGKDTTYIPAVVLRNAGIVVKWDEATRSVYIVTS